MMTACRPDDAWITAYRQHGAAIAKGVDCNSAMAELFGKHTGNVKGKGGSMHFFHAENRYFGGHGIVGASVPLGAGLAFARKYRGTNDICVCYYGDGAANQGQVYEAYNMAALWGLPILFVIENNEYAMGTSVQRSHAATELFRAGESLGVQGEQVNGMDVIEVMEKERPKLLPIGKNYRDDLLVLIEKNRL